MNKNKSKSDSPQDKKQIAGRPFDPDWDEKEKAFKKPF